MRITVDKIVKKIRKLFKQKIFSLISYFKLIYNWNTGKKWAKKKYNWLNSKSKPLVSIIVPTYRRIGALIDAVESIRTHTDNYEIIIINSGSGLFGDWWIDKQRKVGDVIVVLDNGRRFNKRIMSQSYFYNLGYQIANGKYIVHFADDCVATPYWTKEAIQLLEDDERNGLAVFFGQPGYYGIFSHTIYLGKYKNKDQHYPVAHWWMGRKIDLIKIGFMNENYDYYYNDLDISVRVINKLKKRVVICYNSRIIHKDKELVYRQKTRGGMDAQYFDSQWKEIVGFSAEDTSKVICLYEDECQEWAEKNTY